MIRRLKVGLVVLPYGPWSAQLARWAMVESLGFDHGWTYDHAVWPRAGAGNWYSAIPVMASAAMHTRNLELGCLVFSPNLHEPVTLAKNLSTLGELSAGRFRPALGAGSAGDDARLASTGPLAPAQRADRFAEFVVICRQVLEDGRAEHDGHWFSVHEQGLKPTYLLDGRAPLLLAGNGPRSMRLAARHGAGWVTDASFWRFANEPESALRDHIAGLMRTFERACAHEARPVEDMRRILLLGARPTNPFADPDTFIELCQTYATLGFTDLVFHIPGVGEPFPGSIADLEAIADRGLFQAKHLPVGPVSMST